MFREHPGNQATLLWHKPNCTGLAESCAVARLRSQVLLVMFVVFAPILQGLGVCLLATRGFRVLGFKGLGF